MKKILLISLSLFSVLALLSCKGADEDKAELNGSLFVKTGSIKATEVTITVAITNDDVITDEIFKLVAIKDGETIPTKEIVVTKVGGDIKIDSLTTSTKYDIALTVSGELLENKIQAIDLTTIAGPMIMEVEGSITKTTNTTITITTDVIVTLTSSEFSVLEAQINEIDVEDPNEVVRTPVDGTIEYGFDKLTPHKSYVIGFLIKDGIDDIYATSIISSFPNTLPITVEGYVTKITDTKFIVRTNINIPLTSGEFSVLETHVKVINADDPDEASPTLVEGTTKYMFEELVTYKSYKIEYSIKDGLKNVNTIFIMSSAKE